jgi:hypothetical protein
MKTETISGLVHVRDDSGELAAVVVELPDGAGWGAAVRGRPGPVTAPSLDQALRAVEIELQRPATPAAMRAQSEAQAREEHRAAWRRDVGHCAGDRQPGTRLTRAAAEAMARADAERRGIEYRPEPEYAPPKVAEAPAGPAAPSAEEAAQLEQEHRAAMRAMLGSVAGGVASQHRFFRRRSGAEAVETAVRAALAGKEK